MKLLSLARDLKRRKSRERQGLFVAEGIRTAESLLASGVTVLGALFAPVEHERAIALRRNVVERGIPVLDVTLAEFQSAADTESPQGALLLGEIPHYPLQGLPSDGDVVLLDGVQDPGNVGTIVRAAVALGAAATLALPGTVDLWNAKVVRSAMGALFTHPTCAVSWEETSAWLDARDCALWVAAADGEPVDVAVRSRPDRLALVVANEGAGVSSPVAAHASRRVSIPMMPGTDSLNVAVATGILLYALRRHDSA